MAEILDTYTLDTKKAQAELNKLASDFASTGAAAQKAGATSSKAFADTAIGADKASRSFSGFGNSISQFSRELPNLAFGFDLFFRSISNQFGQFEDDLKRIRAQNEQLALSGQKQISVFKQFAVSLFTVSTLLQIGVTLLTVYGGKLVELAKSAFSGRKAIDETRESVKTLNEAYASKNLQTAIKDFVQLRSNVQRAKEGFVDKKFVIDAYNNSVGIVSGQVKTLEEAEKGLINNTAAYIKAIVNREAANIQAGKIGTLLIEKEQKLAEGRAAYAKQYIADQKTIEGVEAKRSRQTDIPKYEENLKGIQVLLQQRRDRIRDSYLAETKIIDENINTQTKILDKFADKSGLIDKPDKDIAGAFAILNKQISDLETRIKDGLTKGYNSDADISKLNALKKKLTEITTEFERLSGGGDIQGIPMIELGFVEALQKSSDERDKIQKKDVDRMERNYAQDVKNFKERQEEKTKIDKDEQKNREDINKAFAQAGFDIASTFSNELFSLKDAQLKAETDAQLKALDEQYEIDKENAEARGATKQEQKEIEKQYEREVAAVKNQAAQEQRKADLAEILVKGALATINAYASAPILIAPILAGAVAVITGLQYAFAASQPLPQYALGTTFSRHGKAIVDEQGAELRISPSGKVVLGSDKGANIAHLEAGTKIYNARDTQSILFGQKMEPFLMMKHITPYIDEMNRSMSNHYKQENSIKVQNNFNDKRIVNGIEETNRLNRKIAKSLNRKQISNSVNRRLSW